jgi:hypothetical protein
MFQHLKRSVRYVRVSSFDQNPERQLENISLKQVFTDKASGKDTIVRCQVLHNYFCPCQYHESVSKHSGMHILS